MYRFIYIDIYIRAYVYIRTCIQDKEVGFKGLIAPVAAIVLPLSHASMPPFIEHTQGGVADTSHDTSDKTCDKTSDDTSHNTSHKTSDKKEVSKGGKFVDPDADMVTWTVLDLSSFAMVCIFQSLCLCVFESLCVCARVALCMRL